MLLDFNPILDTDSYKPSHPAVYPKGMQGLYAYIEARVKKNEQQIVVVGQELHIDKFFSTQITQAHIDEAIEMLTLHGEPFDPEPWQYLVDQYDGYWPVTIWGVPEGTVVPSGQVQVALECADPKLAWVASWLETTWQRAVWYPSTIATRSREAMRLLKRMYTLTGAPLEALPFALHDFGARGATSYESAAVGGYGHLAAGFMGSDNLPAIRETRQRFKSAMPAFSVPATEHSVECSYGLDQAGEDAYLERVLDVYAKPGKIISIVLDGRDVIRASERLCTKYRDRIIASGATIVFRPDSGNMMELVPRILEMQAMAFGVTTSIGTDGREYRKPKHVGVLQGDGINYKSMGELLGIMVAQGFRADCVVFGSGGDLLQNVTRDTFKYAQKASAILMPVWIEDGDIGSRWDYSWKGYNKDPITDPGKASKMGRVMLFKSRVTGEFASIDIDRDQISNEWEPMFKLLYRNGTRYSHSTLEEIRERTRV